MRDSILSEGEINKLRQEASMRGYRFVLKLLIVDMEKNGFLPLALATLKLLQECDERDAT